MSAKLKEKGLLKIFVYKFKLSKTPPYVLRSYAWAKPPPANKLDPAAVQRRTDREPHFKIAKESKIPKA